VEEEEIIVAAPLRGGTWEAYGPREYVAPMRKPNLPSLCAFLESVNGHEHCIVMVLSRCRGHSVVYQKGGTNGTEVFQRATTAIAAESKVMEA
jgi:hypothetical protein